MEHNIDLTEVLSYIDPALLSYQEWLAVGMALKSEGYSSNVWDNWSRTDSGRYHSGECERKWEGFNGSANPVTGATIVQMAKDSGWQPQHAGRELDWDDIICRDEGAVIDENWLEEREINEPEFFDPAKELITYLETLFEAGENVGYVVESWEKDGRFLPANKGSYDRTAGQLIELLSKCNGDIGSVLGDYNPKAGAWIRFNPLDGKGVKNENVTEFRYALVESDSAEIEKQNALIRELELPVACLVYSGGKSLHAIVKIDAANYEEYRKRVDYLYEVCRKNGFEIDRNNRNPSRLSRMPGIIRGEHKQYIVDTNIGKRSYSEWKEWIESINDDLPDPENMGSVWDNLPELSPPLIKNVLRQGHKMLLAGPSKAGKSYALIELCCSIAEGKNWFGFECTQGKVLYVNLELDRASCLHRFKDVYKALKWEPENLSNIDIWNLRGKSLPMDKLAPKLIRRAAKKNYIAIIIDPIYKIITGDENSADQMARFCNQFDMVCTELSCAVIYCHHHSKGAQGGKRSMDRASGSGVFARDPDALIDITELEITDALIKAEDDKAVCRICKNWIDRFYRTPFEVYDRDDICSASRMREIAREKLQEKSFNLMEREIEAAKKALHSRSAWRIEGTLREFARFEPISLWFDYPIHKFDDSGALKDLDYDGEMPNWKNKSIKNSKKNQKDEDENADSKLVLENAFSFCDDGNGEVRIKEIAKHIGMTDQTVKNYVDKHPEFERGNGIVRRVKK